MKRIAFFALTLCILVSCGTRREYKDALLRAETVMDEHPDSAMMILDSLGQHESEFNRHFRMQYQLHRQNAVNKTSDKFTSDSLCQVLVSYFDRHGSVNERVLAHYLLGRAYTDMGEAPMAISSYQDATSVADTTATDFNYSTLSCAYSQMASLFRQQLLLTNEIEAREKASHYAFRANQIQWGLYDQVLSAGAYILLNKKDSAEIILKSALEQYRKHGYTQEALRFSKKLMYLYTEPPQRLAEAKALMDKFEAESDLFDEKHELPPSQHQYYYYKGKYYEGINKLDSAEYCYRKMYYPRMTPVDQDPMYSGLLSVFTKRHQADSIAKYAKLYCMANDSSIALKDRETVAQMTATYNYNRSQKELEKEKEKARTTRMVAAGIIGAGLLLMGGLTWLYNRKQERRKARIIKLEDELNSAMSTRNELRAELEQLQNKDYESVIAVKESKVAELTKTIEWLRRENQAYKTESPDIETDRLDDFLNSGIALLFTKKTTARAEKPQPTEAEWKMLVSQFSKDVPVMFQSFGEGKSLSPLEQRICILLLMDIPEKTITAMTDSAATTVSNAKARANKKLYGKKDAFSLKNNLIHALKQF